MTIELRWLHSFLAVADEHHFSRAARRLNLAQPALTAHIQQLEAAVGAVLFERTNRMTGLTPAGRALLPEAQAIVDRASGLRRAAQQAEQGETGRLRLGLIPPAATREVAEALRGLARAQPEIEVQVRQAGQHLLEARLAAGDLDLVLGRAPSDPALGHRRLFIEEQGVLLRADDPRAQRPIVPLRELAGSRLVLLRGNPHFGQNFLELASRHRVALTSLHGADDFPALQWMVRAGLGVAPCSLLLQDALPAGLVARAVRPALPKLELHAVWRGRAPGPVAARWLGLLAPAKGA